MKHKITHYLQRYPVTKRIYIGIKTFMRNIQVLFTQDLGTFSRNYDIGLLRYELAAELPHTSVPSIKTIDETLDMLIHSHNSLCRFGDGEFENILQHPQNFSNAALALLSKRLLEVLGNKDSRICIGLPRKLYEGKQNLSSLERLFWRSAPIKQYYSIIEQYCLPQTIYYAVEVTMPFCYTDINLEQFFHKIRKIWANKDITLICGDGIFKNLEYDIFDNVKSRETIYAPNKNAFTQYESILKRALQIDKHRLIIIILGQTATVLAYDLAKQGFRALDFGHIAKSYDWYKRNKLHDPTTFFDPD